MKGIEIIFAVLVALTALLVVIVVYKMTVKQKNLDILKEQVQKKRRRDVKGGAEFTAGASGREAAETAAPVSDDDQHFRPSG
jgi:Na+/melibiose symporter-like transporter